jgi:hypothetical protein
MPAVSDDFYEDDEPIDDIRSVWKNGEKGVSSGKRDLDERARSVVDRAVAYLEDDSPERTILAVVKIGTAAGDPIERDQRVVGQRVASTEKLDISI